jgi:protein-S-isoprenylcysteine O-methyltransferase Ste14
MCVAAFVWLSWTGAALFLAALLHFVWRYFGAFDASGGSLDPVWAALLDVALFSAFALHHSLFARSGLKRWLGQRLSPAGERVLYVWIASVLFIAVCAWWKPVGGTAWAWSGGWAWIARALVVSGVGLTLYAAAVLDVFELAGVRPLLSPRTRPDTLRDDGAYGIVRHPIYLGWILIVWPVPVMTWTRLVFAAVSTAYLVIAIPFEERGLRAHFGDAYAAYAKKVRFRMLPFVY